jgi:outer membrane lipoprotein LolB
VNIRLILVCGFLVSGCATMERAENPLSTSAERQEQVASMLALSVWQFNGRIAIKHQSEGAQGSLRWRQEGDHAVIQISGPLSLGAVEIDWTAERITVNGKEGEVSLAYEGTDAAEQFLEAQLGWSFPAGSIRYWVLGVLDPAYEGRELYDLDGRLIGLEQNGWKTDFSRFVEVSGQVVPAKLQADNSRARIRLSIHDWIL